MIDTLVTTTLFLLLLFSVVMALGGLKNLARGRKYKSGTGWCAWRWTDVESEYILRLHVVKTPWFAVCLHWIQKPDQEPWLHDHPVSFLSCILRGQYAEYRRRPDGTLYLKVNRWFNFVRASNKDQHRICFVRANTLTLCFMGPKTREWGFHVWQELQPGPTVLGPAGWLYWKDYYARLKAGEPLRTLPFDTVEAAAQCAGARFFERERAFKDGKYVDEERELDTRPADEFNADEVTWPGEHR